MSELVYKCLNGNGPAYLADSLQRVTDIQSRRRLRSSSSSTLIVPVTRRTTLGDRRDVHGLDSSMDWIGLDWIGLGGIGLGRILENVAWIGLDWIGSNDCSVQNYDGLYVFQL